MSKHARSAQGRSAGAAVGRVRIIGGSFRRTPIAVVAAPGLRPTPDRVRETVFNWLEHLFAGLPGSRALDLFAGSGALGFEMASRGAAHVVLVDHDARTVRALRALRERLAATNVEVLHGNWRSVLPPMTDGSFDVIFLDPPFDSGLLPAALAAVRRLLAPAGLIYAEAAERLDAQELSEQGWEVVRAGKAGGVHFHLLRSRPC